MINIARFALIGIIPLIIILLTYVALDPFKVVRKYDTFYDIDAKGSVAINRDYVSTTTFANNYNRENYNSFIFGNSRSILYQVSDWKKHLPPAGSCYHFDASGESLYALHKKLEYLDRKGIDIKNGLLILDYVILNKDKPKAGHLFVLSPELVNNRNIIDFHLTSFKAFFSYKFLYAYIDFQISGVVKPYMKKNYLLDDTPVIYDINSNEIRFDYFEDLIIKNKYYDAEKISVFYKRDTMLHYSTEAIKENQKSMLTSIYNIFLKHKTDYKIIISPLYDQVKINQNDLKYLNNLFGKKNVFDFSGINKYTNDYKNYYEISHYRPHVARELLDEVYRAK